MTAISGQIAPKSSIEAERTEHVQRLPRNRRRYALDKHARPFVGKPTASDLATVRGVAGLSLAQLADALQVEARTVSRMLAGKASVSPMQFTNALRLASLQAPDAIAWLSAQAGPEWFRRHVIVDRSKPGRVEIGLMPA